MAVAVKNNRETTSPSMFDRLPVAILMGVLYVVGSLGIVFPLLDRVWWYWLGLDRDNPVWWVLEVLAGAGALAGLVVIGSRLLGSHPARGLKAGIAVGCVGVFLVAGLTLWAGLWLEHLFYSSQMFSTASASVGAVLTSLIGIALLVALGWNLASEKGEQWLGALEDQGWFSLTSYKRNQGLRVRRGTIIGILLLAGSGVYTLHLQLQKEASDWTVSIPFTGQVAVTPGTAGDNPKVQQAVKSDTAYFDRFELHALNQEFQKNHVKIKDPGSSPAEKSLEFTPGEVVSRATFDAEQQLRKDEKKRLEDNAEPDKAATVKLATEAPVAVADGVTAFDKRILLPHVKFTLPLLLLGLALYLSWRVVNVPAFGDFLIATEAEMNKVSWATRKQLVQDTIVVLVTVILMTVFLLFADVFWTYSLKFIGVLRGGSSATATQNEALDPKW